MVASIAFDRTISVVVALDTDVHSLEHVLLALFDSQQLRRKCVQHSLYYTDPQGIDYNTPTYLPVRIPAR